MADILSISPRTIQVEIPDELALYVLQQTEVCGRYLRVRNKGNRTHRLARYFGFYLLLKAEAPESGWIQNYTRQIPELSANFGISQRSFFSYMAQLEKMKIAFRQGNDIRIVGWKELERLFHFDTRPKTKIEFQYDGKQKIHWWFAALDIAGNQDAQRYMIWKKVNKNSEIKNALLTAMHTRGFDIANADDPEWFAGALFSLYLENFRTGTEVHDLLIAIRADVNRSCRRLAEDWNISAQLTTYWKRRMQQQQIIDIAKVHVVSQYSQETKECHKNKHCHVIWNDKIKERVWFLCDQLSVVMPWKWREFLKKNMAGTAA